MANEIDALLQEHRSFPPSDDFRRNANANDETVYDVRDREAFWASWADELDWQTKWDKVLEWDAPYAKWFVGGKLNASANCLDRHLAERGDKKAVIWEGEPGDVRTFTYRELHAEVSKFANVLKSLGVQLGDRVAIYMPMVPEAIVAMLACARIGAAHSVVFGGFSSEALRDRIQDAQAKVLITATAGYRRGNLVPLKKLADAATADCPSIEHVVVVMRRAAAEEMDDTVSMQPDRDCWYHDLMNKASADCEPTWVDSEQMLYTLYTSGTTGKPKGIIHTTGGYLTGCYATCKWIFDLKENDVYWCTADIGWVTGHSYVVYGPLAAGATVFVYEGAPDWPKQDRFWSLIEKHKSHDLLHGADGDPRVHEMGTRAAGITRSLVAPPPRISRRADQSRGVDVVPEMDRRRALPDRRHVVADRDRDDPDLAAARPRGDEARLGDAGVPRHRREDPR